jgi:hypothetical protein
MYIYSCKQIAAKTNLQHSERRKRHRVLVFALQEERERVFAMQPESVYRAEAVGTSRIQ